MGLGSTVLVTLYITFFETAVSHYALFVGAVTVVVGVVALVLLDLPPYYLTTRQKAGLTEEDRENVARLKVQYETPSPPKQEARRKQSFLIGYVILLTMLVFLTAFNIIVVYVDTTHAFDLGCCIAAVTLLASFAAMPLWAALVERKKTPYKEKNTLTLHHRQRPQSLSRTKTLLHSSVIAEPSGSLVYHSIRRRSQYPVADLIVPLVHVLRQLRDRNHHCTQRGTDLPSAEQQCIRCVDQLADYRLDRCVKWCGAYRGWSAGHMADTHEHADPA